MKAVPRRADSLRDSDFGVILGSGLGGVSDAYRSSASVGFEEIGGLTPADIAGHRGEFTRCAIGSRWCLFVRGRKHHYEDKVEEVQRLMRFIRSLGVERLLLTSAAGSIDPALPPGQLVLIEHLLDFQHRAPPIASTRPRTGLCRPPVVGRRLELDAELNATLRRCAIVAGISLAPGTMASCAGPAYETRAEVSALQRTGATVVSMSVAPEVAAANALGIRVATVALVTNWATGISGTRPRHADVLASGRHAEAPLRRLIAQFAANV